MNTPTSRRRTLIARAVSLALGLGVWFAPVPEGLTRPAWHLFALFIAAIFSVVAGAFRILTASVLALAAAVLGSLLLPSVRKVELRPVDSSLAAVAQ